MIAVRCCSVSSTLQHNGSRNWHTSKQSASSTNTTWPGSAACTTKWIGKYTRRVLTSHVSGAYHRRLRGDSAPGCTARAAFARPQWNCRRNRQSNPLMQHGPKRFLRPHRRPEPVPFTESQGASNHTLAHTDQLCSILRCTAVRHIRQTKEFARLVRSNSNSLFRVIKNQAGLAS